MGENAPTEIEFDVVNFWRVIHSYWVMLSNGGSAVKNPPAMQETAYNIGDMGSVLGR